MTQHTDNQEPVVACNCLFNEPCYHQKPQPLENFEQLPDTQPKQDELQASIDRRLKTAYELARAATPTEDGRKAIDFFYSVHLNNWPGFANDLVAADKLSLLERLEKQQFTAHAGKRAQYKPVQVVTLSAIQQEKDAIIGKERS